jgi:hypothetical protein
MFVELHQATTISERDMKTAFKYIVKNMPALLGSSANKVNAVESLVVRIV